MKATHAGHKQRWRWWWGCPQTRLLRPLGRTRGHQFNCYCIPFNLLHLFKVWILSTPRQVKCIFWHQNSLFGRPCRGKGVKGRPKIFKKYILADIEHVGFHAKKIFRLVSGARCFLGEILQSSLRVENLFSKCLNQF